MRSHWIQSDEHFPHATCAERARVCSARQIQIHANEYVLPNAGDGTGSIADVCRQFINMVILRNPVSRAVSNIMHMHQMYIWNNASAQFPGTFKGIAELAPRVVNNMYIRALLGQQVGEYYFCCHVYIYSHCVFSCETHPPVVCFIHTHGNRHTL